MRREFDSGALRVSPAEIRKQTARIVDSPVFFGGLGYRKKPVGGPLLNYLVEEVLKGKKPDDRSVVTEFFKQTYLEFPDTNTIGRTNLKNLRKDLSTYYATIGLNDPIMIEIPLGQYVAEFTPNPRSKANQLVKIVNYQVNREAPENILHAIEQIDEAIKLEADSVDAHEAKAAALIAKTLHVIDESPEADLAGAEVSARRALELNDKAWRARFNLAIVHLFRHEWERSDAEMAIAEEINQLAVYEYTGYGVYLTSRGKQSEALKLAKLYREEYGDDVVFVNRAGLYLYVMRRLDESKGVLSEVLKLDKNFWQSHMILSFVNLAANNYSEALHHAQQMSLLVGSEVWPGLVIQCLAANGKSAEAGTKFTDLLESANKHYVKPLQIGLGYLALDDPLKAIEFFEKACDEFDPFTIWIHVMPLFDAVRDYPRFQKLLARWKFPRFVLS